MSASSSSSDAAAGKGGGGGGGATTGGSAAAPAAKKTNVCLICGIYTNLSLNIFEPRNGPNIREVIYQKYNFRAERGDNENKYICYSCNNWLINWYSLQHLSESRNYESTPSSSRSQSENRNKRSKNERSHSKPAAGSSRDKENLEQDDQVSSTVKTPEKENGSPKRKPKRSLRRILKDSNQQNSIPTSSSSLVKPFESRLIRMLENQGTSVIKENVPPCGGTIPNPINPAKSLNFAEDKSRDDELSTSNEIVLSFNSAISEVVNVMPSLKSLRPDESDQELISPTKVGVNFLNTHRLSRSLSISLIETIPTGNSQTQAEN